jgi:anti-sigma factor RsiW
MGHFDAPACADYVRGVLGPKRRTALERHIATCRSCATTVRWLREVAEIAAADEEYEPPPHVLRHARALFAVEREKIMRALPRLLGRLTFDSFAQPIAQGVRGPSGMSRQAVFEAADYAVDITVDQAPGAPRAMLVGQVVSRQAAAAPIAAAPVLLTAGEIVVARTVCDRYGEFLLEYDPQPRLRLHVVVDEGRRRIEMPLDSHGKKASRGKRSKPSPASRKRH